MGTLDRFIRCAGRENLELPLEDRLDELESFLEVVESAVGALENPNREVAEGRAAFDSLVEWARTQEARAGDIVAASRSRSRADHRLTRSELEESCGRLRAVEEEQLSSVDAFDRWLLAGIESATCAVKLNPALEQFRTYSEPFQSELRRLGTEFEPGTRVHASVMRLADQLAELRQRH
ncbi:MAG: hypothetical protein AAFQ82_01110 [Myxococcota bacterium]